jgi:hypothetical protein
MVNGFHTCFHRIESFIMRRTMPFVTVVVVFGAMVPVFGGDQSKSRSARSEPLKIALHYDFFLTDGSTISDASGNKLDGMLSDGVIVEGRGKNAVKFDGKGMISVPNAPDTLDPSRRLFTVGALCQPSTPDGVVLSMGDKTNGFSLYLKGGVPHFAIRAKGVLTKVAGTEPVPLDQWVHLAGTLDEKGAAWLIINTWPEAHAKAALLSSKPIEPFCVGADPGAPVSDDTSSKNWHGLIQDVRLYWGRMTLEENREEFKDWARMPGCGCK